MATNNDNNTQIIEPEVTEEIAAVAEAEVPAVKTKKELKKERKEIKKHKKEVKKEARKHSAKATRAYNALVTIVSLIVIAAMLVCSFTAIKITKSLNSTDTSSSASSDAAQDSSSSSSASTPSNDSSASQSTPSDSASSDTSADTSADAEGGESEGDATTPLGSKAEVVEYYKTAHAKVLSEAKSVTRTYDNTTNYNEYLEVGGNSTLASVAKQLMGMFMKENTEALNYTGSDIAANFPPTNNSCSGLTADMIGDYSVKEEGDNYIITLTLNSTEENPDLGDNSAHLVNIVATKTVEEAAAGFVSFTGPKNKYIAPTVTATVNKTSGQMTALELDTPSYMCFDSATVMKIITVDNVGIGLEYTQKWTIEW